MVDYPDLSSLNATSGIAGILSLPNNSYPYFWIWIFAGLWMIISMTLYFKEKERTGRGHFLSCMGVSSIAILVLSTISSIIGFIKLEIFIYIIAFCFTIIAIWFFSE